MIRMRARVLLSTIIVICASEAVGAAFTVASPILIPPSLAFLFAFEAFFVATSALFSQLQYPLYALLIASALVGVFHGKKPSADLLDARDVEEGSASLSPPNRTQYLMLAFALLISTFLVALPRLSQTLPIGGDTLYSMSVVQILAKEGPLWALRFSDRPIFYLATYALGGIFGLSVFQLFVVLPVILGAILTASTWLLVSSFYKGAAGFAALLTAVSLSLMRTSIDLYASFFATSLFFLTLAAYISRDKQRGLYRIILPLMLVVLLLSYWFLWAFLVLILATATLVSSDRRAKFKGLIFSNLPAAGVLGLFVLVATLMPPPTYWGFGSSFANYLGRAVSPTGVLNYHDATFSFASIQLVVGQGNFVMPLLAAAGLFATGPKSFALKVIYLWSCLALGLSLVSIVQTHAALLFPLPILAGIGLRKIVERS